MSIITCILMHDYRELNSVIKVDACVRMYLHKQVLQFNSLMYVLSPICINIHVIILINMRFITSIMFYGNQLQLRRLHG